MMPSVANQSISQDFIHHANTKPGLGEESKTSPLLETQSKLQGDVKVASFLGSQSRPHDVCKLEPDKTASLAAEDPTPESVRCLWQSIRSVQSISPEQLSPDDVVIAVTGPSGAGKSFFIEAATGTPSGVGHNLESCTVEISAKKVTFMGKSVFSGVIFVDTPGFEVEGLAESDILKMIAQWLQRSAHRNVCLSGILYLHRITDNRMTGTPLKNHRIFRELCGTDALQHIALTTTMWDDAQDGEGDDREKELCATYWKMMTQQGSIVTRFLGTMESCWNVVEPFLLKASDRLAAQKSARALWKSERRVQLISSAEHLSLDDVIIAVIGPSGAGKSSFIEAATGVARGVGHNLESCTTEISATKVTFLEKSAFGVVFVDTPGFVDTNGSDSEILEMISQWLKKNNDRSIRLPGMIYLHRISDNRVAGSPLRNLSRFYKLCGKDALQRIILTTTMWDDLQIDEGNQREQELCAGYWKTMALQGSKVTRFSRTTESAWSIVEPILLEADNLSTIEIQREMVDLEKQLPETKAGKELYITLDKLVQEQREMLRRIREESERTRDERGLSQLKSEYDELRKKLGATIADMQVLRVPLRTRLIRMLLWPLGLFVKGIMK